jgi:hypothetical protein
VAEIRGEVINSDLDAGAERKRMQRWGCLSAPILIVMICIFTAMVGRIEKNPTIAGPLAGIAVIALVGAYVIGRLGTRWFRD